METPIKNSSNGWSIDIFEKARPHLINFIKNKTLPLIDNANCPRILIRAPVKSGKRETAEYIAKRDESYNPQRVHAYISSFVRKADEEQRKEMKLHNLEVFTFLKKRDVEICIEWIKKQLSINKNVVLHYDECDFGSGHTQLLSKIYKTFHDNTKVKKILYSATPEEVFFSKEVIYDDESDEIIDDFKENGRVVYYNPPPEFCGPSKFLDANLVKNATPFFYVSKNNKLELSSQAKYILTSMRDNMKKGSKRNIIMLRLSASDTNKTELTKKDNKSIYQFCKKWKEIQELSDVLLYADKDEKEIPDSIDVIKTNIQYSNPLFWKGITTDHPVIIIYDQTSSRSTEWKFHDRIYATHDFRNIVNYSIVSQAQERVNHYSTTYGEFQPILIYGHLKTFQLSAGRINYIDYVKQDWKKKKLDIRVATRLKLEGPHYMLQYKDTIVPEYPHPLLEEECNKILQEKGCFSEIRISPRVKNTIKYANIYDVKFYICNKNTFDQINNELKNKFPAHSFNNPFINSEKQGLSEDNKYKGYLREWKVWDYKEIETQPGWGAIETPRLTICYNNDILGVAVRYPSGNRKKTGDLETCKSMYKK